MRFKILLFQGILQLFAFLGFSQQSNDGYFLLKGKLEGRNSALVSLSYFDRQQKLKTDTVKVNQGEFRFSGFLFSPTAGVLRDLGATDLAEDPNICTIYLVPDTMLFYAKINSFKNAEVMGSVPHSELAKFNLEKGMYSGIAQELAFISRNPNSFISGYLLDRIMPLLSFDSLKICYGSLNPVVQNSIEGKRVSKFISSRLNSSVGMNAPVFEGLNSKGEPFSLTSLKNKKLVLLDFWGSWCIPCRKNAPDLIDIYEKFYASGFDIVGIANDDNRVKKWKEAIISDKTDRWHHVLQGFDLIKFANGVENHHDIGFMYGVNTFPTYILLNQNGVIIARFEGNDFSKVRKVIEDFFQNSKEVH